MTPTASLGLRFVVGIGGLAIGPTLVFSLLRGSGLLAATDDTVVHMEQSLLCFGLAAAGVAAFAQLQPPGAPWRPLAPGDVAARYVPFVVVWLLALVGYLAVARAAGFEVPAQAQLRYLAAADLARPGCWVAIATVVGFGPLAEEVVFRGFLQPALLAVMRPVPAIALASLVFGLAHTAPYTLPVAGLGAFFGWFAWRRSLGAAVLAHALHNAVTVLVTLLWPGHLDLLYPR